MTPLWKIPLPPAKPCWASPPTSSATSSPSTVCRFFTAKQIAHWLYVKHAVSIDEMTNLSKAARERLSAHYEVGGARPVESQRSVDGTVKYLFRTGSGHYVETVYIPDDERATLCVSCQVGCKMGCAFCMTGRQGFVAHLAAADILGQLHHLPERERLTNVVFMGQGEPFDNLDNVLRATTVLTADWGWAWSPRRITVSSVGLAKGLRRFLDESECHLAISLHHPPPRGAAAPDARRARLRHPRRGGTAAAVRLLPAPPRRRHDAAPATPLV